MESTHPIVEVTPRAEQQLYRGSKQLYSESIEENLQIGRAHV